jgi:hypothetical protein
MPDGQQSTKFAIIAAVISFVVLNAAFLFLSANYFESHREVINGALVQTYTADQITHLREMFAISCGLIIVVNFLVGLRRRVGAHVLPAVLGAASIFAGIASIATGMPGTLAVVQLVSGALMPTLAWFSFRGRRAPWAFLVAICGVFAVVALFGAPRIGHALSINLWTTMIIPGLYAVATVALIQLRSEYIERDAVVGVGAAAAAGSA